MPSLLLNNSVVGSNGRKPVFTSSVSLTPPLLSLLYLYIFECTDMAIPWISAYRYHPLHPYLPSTAPQLPILLFTCSHRTKISTACVRIHRPSMSRPTTPYIQLYVLPSHLPLRPTFSPLHSLACTLQVPLTRPHASSSSIVQSHLC